MDARLHAMVISCHTIKIALFLSVIEVISRSGADEAEEGFTTCSFASGIHGLEPQQKTIAVSRTVSFIQAN